MSRDWTPEELQTASEAMKAAGHMSFEEFSAGITEQAFKKLITKFAEVQRAGFFPCPRCGKYCMSDDPIRNALSRHASIQICDACGTDEAIRDFTREVLPLSEWAIYKNPGVYIRTLQSEE